MIRAEPHSSCSRSCVESNNRRHDGPLVEVHDDPVNAKSDGANALDIKLLKPLLERLLAIHSTAGA